MALPPDSSDTFLREVDENLRRDQFQDFVKTYGKWLIAAVVLFLAGVGGWIYWENEQQKKSAAESEQLHAAFADIASGQTNVAQRKLDAMREPSNDLVRASVVFAQAAIALEKNDRVQAVAKYKQAASDKSLPEAYRDLATIRLTTLEFDSLKPEEVVARLEPMSKAGSPWFGSAGELTGLALLKQGRKSEAGRTFAAVAADKNVPSSIRSRAAQIAGTLGVDATASLPSLEQQD